MNRIEETVDPFESIREPSFAFGIKHQQRYGQECPKLRIAISEESMPYLFSGHWFCS